MLFPEKINPLYSCSQNKCVRYWPSEEGKSETYGNIVVTTVKEAGTSDYALREFKVKCTVGYEEERTIHHYHFLVWPDHGVPSDPACVLNFLVEVNRCQRLCEY